MTAPTAAPTAAPAEAPERVWVVISPAGYATDSYMSVGVANLRARNLRAKNGDAPYSVAAYVPESALAAERQEVARLQVGAMASFVMEQGANAATALDSAFAAGAEAMREAAAADISLDALIGSCKCDVCVTRRSVVERIRALPLPQRPKGE